MKLVLGRARRTPTLGSRIGARLRLSASLALLCPLLASALPVRSGPPAAGPSSAQQPSSQSATAPPPALPDAEAAGAATAADEPPRQTEPLATFGERIEVRLATYVVRALDSYGEPILNLKPADFRVTASGKEVPISSVDWQGYEAEPAPVEAAPTLAPWPPAPPRPAASEGRTMIFFVQADINAPVRTRGHLKLLPLLDEVLKTLTPADRVAVVSFDSHLKLWQDLTADHARVKDALWHAVRFGGHTPAASTAERSPFAARFARAEPEEVATTERAIQVTAEALAAIPGEKVMVYLGWGLGRYIAGFGTEMTHEYGPALSALGRAHATVFVIDVDDSIYHDLEAGLKQVASDTGGTYEKTTYFPSQATHRLARAITGYYLVSVDAQSLPAGNYHLKIDLRHRRGSLLVRPTAS